MAKKQLTVQKKLTALSWHVIVHWLQAHSLNA
jgi:hypothetical protein